MSRLRVRRPSPALIVAMLALLVALGGTSYAVTQLPAKSVGTMQLRKRAVTGPKIRNNAVTSSKVRNGSLLARDFKDGQVPVGAPGPPGPAGEPGQTGAPGKDGVVAAYALVDPNAGGVPTLVANSSEGFVSVMRKFTNTTTQDLYCLKPTNPSLAQRPAFAFVDASLSATANYSVEVLRDKGVNAGGPCPDDTIAVVTSAINDGRTAFTLVVF
jgi:hypothetical protein